MDTQKLLFIFNPKSGKGLIKNHLVDIVDVMVKAGFEVTVYPTQKQGDATEKVIQDGAKYDRIVCSGGDGTLDEVVTGFRETKLKLPLGYIPAGSTNDFARSLNISSDMVKAAKVAVGNHIFPCDVGKFNGDTFVYIAAFGIFTDLSYETPQTLKNMLGHMAYVLSAAKSLWSIPNYQMIVDVDGEVIEDKFIYGMITNSVSVAGFSGITGQNVLFDDGEFEVTLIKNPKKVEELNEILLYLTNLTSTSSMIYTYKAKKIRIVSEKEVPWTLDGEFGGNHTLVSIENRPKKINLLIE